MNSEKHELKAPLLEQDKQDPKDIPNSEKVDKKSVPVEEPEYPPVSFTKLLRFATPYEKFLFSIACLLSILTGGAFPLFSLFWGETANAFSPDIIISGKLKELVGKYALKIGGIGVAVMLLFLAILSLLRYVSQKQGTRLKAAYLQAILRQEMGYFDKIDPAELSSRIEDDCKTILEGCEDKVFMFIFGVFTFIGGFGVAFYRGWQLTLILLGLTPFQAISGAVYGRFVAKAVDRNTNAYAKAGAIAEQALSSIRTIVGLAGEDKEVRRYSSELSNTKRTMMKYGLIQGLSIGFFSMTSYLFYATAFFFGSKFILNHVYDSGSQRDYTGGDVISVYFAVVSGSVSLVVTAPSMKAFAAAKQTASKVFALIDRQSKINPEDTSGIVPNSFEAKIIFKDVDFSFPNNLDKTILNKVNFELTPGKTTAIVGESGSGKSTIVQLIERLYDPQAGSIELDGHDLRSLNLKWLRNNISYVGQEPVLFTGTIRENLELARENITEDEMIEALKKANAYDFVMKLEKKLDTYVGIGGIQLSGGQKQRIAISRAILRNSKILLLDEATSALDRKNEKAIQETLDHISTGLTTVIIAHRLSTIKNADNIIVLNNGVIEESGTHHDLVLRQGRYYQLQQGQLNLEEEVGEEAHEESGEREAKEEEQRQIELEPEEKEKEPDQDSVPTNARQDEFSIKIDSPIKSPSKNSTEKETPKKETPNKDAKSKGISSKQALVRLFTFSRPERPLFLCSLLVSILMGMVSPLMAILISNVLFVLLDPTKPDFEYQANMYSLGFLVTAFLIFILYTLQFWFFSILSESLTNRLRGLVFKKYLHMHMAWHDQAENSAGALSTTLSTDASNVSSLTSTVIGLIFQGISSLASGIVIAFVSCWQIAVASVLTVPIFIILGAIQRSISSKIAAQVESTKKSSQIASEAVNNVRTVACLGKEEVFRQRYRGILKSVQKTMISLGSKQALVMGANQMVIYLYFGATFFIGAIATADLHLDPKEVFIALFAVINALMSLSGSFRYMPDVAKANTSAALLFKHIDMKSEIDIDDSLSKRQDPIRGYIEFRNVSFKFPTRQNQVLKDLNFKVEAGQRIALVGPSGCGKSTTIQLLMRFYDVQEGEIFIDGINIKDFNLRHLRRSFGFVFQEPVLFNGTVEYNIKYSKEDATTEEMIQAAKRANAYDFIQRNDFQVVNEAVNHQPQLGVGFERLVGPKGTQLSGGQKQRIAIARAILTSPSVLLLDEATSALDSQNETIVQDSLDKVTQGVTTITVAHRFSTIKSSNEILVFREGEIVERGTYDSLTNMKGYFYQLERGLD